MSNNVAEYAALCQALKFLLEKKRENSPIEVRGDSTLVMNQMSGDWKFGRACTARCIKKHWVCAPSSPISGFDGF